MSNAIGMSSSAVQRLVAREPEEHVNIGRLLVVAGVVLIVLGLVYQFLPALRPGRLPGDISFSAGSTRVFIPLGTSIVLSIVLTLLLGLLSRR
jgi:Protein of unknown function (DUF2905)